MKIRKELLEDIGIPELYYSTSLKDYIGCERALKQVRKYLKKAQYALDTGVGMLLFGDQNSNKTLLLTCMLKHLSIVEGFSVRYTTMPFLMDVLTKQMDISFRAVVREPHFLCLDSLEGYGVDFEKRTLNRVIKLRQDDGKPTLIGTREKPENFSTAFNPVFAAQVEVCMLSVECVVEPMKLHEHSAKLKAPLEI